MLLELRPDAASDLKLSSSKRVQGCPLISPSSSPSWRGSDAIRVLLFSLTLRSGQAILRYYPPLLSSWPTSSTDAHRLRSIPEWTFFDRVVSTECRAFCTCSQSYLPKSEKSRQLPPAWLR